MAAHDLVIRGGTVVDGTRVPRYKGDVWIKDGKVAQIGGRAAGSADRVIDADGLTVIDTTATPQRGAEVRAAMEALTADLGLPIKRVLLSSSRVAFTGGGTSFWPAAYYGTDPVSDQLDEPANPEVFRRLLPDLASAYDDEFVTRPVTHTVSERAWLTPAVELVCLPGEGPANLVAVVPAAGVVFAGALASFGVTPLAFDGDPLAWTLDKIKHRLPAMLIRCEAEGIAREIDQREVDAALPKIAAWAETKMRRKG